MTDFLKAVEAPVNPNIPDLRPGDAVSVHVRIKEGERKRIQEFKGTVIRLRHGGVAQSFTVRRIASNGVGVERTFMVRSPRVDKVVVERHTHIRRGAQFLSIDELVDLPALNVHIVAEDCPFGPDPVEVIVDGWYVG